MQLKHVLKHIHHIWKLYSKVDIFIDVISLSHSRVIPLNGMEKGLIISKMDLLE